MRCVLCERCVGCCERQPALHASGPPIFLLPLSQTRESLNRTAKQASSPTTLGPFLASGLRTTTQRSPHSLCHQRFRYLLLRLLTSLCLLIVPYPFLFTYRSPNTLLSHRRHSFDLGFIYSSIVLVRAFHPAPLLLCLSHIPRQSIPVSTFSVHRLATVAASARHSWKKGSGPEARKEGRRCRDAIMYRYQSRRRRRRHLDTPLQPARYPLRCGTPTQDKTRRKGQGVQLHHFNRVWHQFAIQPRRVD